MDRLFIPARSQVDIRLPKKAIDTLNRAGIVGVVSTIQHSHRLEGVATVLQKARVIGQVIGCERRIFQDFGNKVDAFLYIGTGMFHPTNLKMKTKKKVYTFDPFTRAFRELTDKDIERAIRKRTAGIVKLLSSSIIGILVTTKEGQENVREAQRLRRDLIKKGKKAYILVAETIDSNLLVSFPFIECFVNSACPRIIEDDLPRATVNIDDAFSAIHGAFEG